MQCSRFHHVLGQLTGNCCAAEGDGNALGTVMRMWTERQIELRAAYNINLTSTALALILSSRHPALDEIQVWCCALAVISCCCPALARRGHSFQTMLPTSLTLSAAQSCRTL